MNQIINKIDKVRVSIVDDQPIFRSGLTAVINAERDLLTCCEASSAPMALETLRRCPADLAVLDVCLPGANGLELIKLIKAEQPRLRILVLSMYDESIYALRALRAGALGYVMKTETVAQVIEALHKVARGEVFVSPKLSEQLLHFSVREGSLDNTLALLSHKEFKVFELFGRGLDTNAVASELNLSAKTIETYRVRIKEKLHFKNAKELVRFAISWFEQEEN